MIVIQRRLFWKVYLTLLASLVAVAVLMGLIWSIIGEGGRPRLGPLQFEVDERLIPERDSPPGALAAAMKRLGEDMDADVSIYDAQGSLVAAHGAPVVLGGGGREGSGRRTPCVSISPTAVRFWPDCARRGRARIGASSRSS